MPQAQMQECIDICTECSAECQDTLINKCLEEGGEHVEAEHVKIMLDCIQICQTAADFMRRSSKFHNYTCSTCAEICDACAESCENIGGEMKQCAEICRRCAETCREMSGMKKAA